MTRPSLPRLGLMLVAVLAMVALASAHPHLTRAQTGPSIVVTPATGSQFDPFTFEGSGFDAGSQLQELYQSPDGTQYTFFINGQPSVVVAGSDGTFSVDVHPATDFQGAAAGTWSVSFCTLDANGNVTSDCWNGTIDISV